MKTLVMTGGTSGLGKEAARIIAETPGKRLILGARGGTAAQGETLAADLSSLASVRTFAQAVIGKLAGSPIDVLALNARAQFADLSRRPRALKRRSPSITSLITCCCGFCFRTWPGGEPRS
jgi:NAD(P)-dependent dehydrogenase (short-subunit alcohol dehydrogenase family)